MRQSNHSYELAVISENILIILKYTSGYHVAVVCHLSVTYFVKKNYTC